MVGEVGEITVRVATGADEMVGIANLLFERDNPFVPVTPLSHLAHHATLDLNDWKRDREDNRGLFLVASMNGRPEFRCCSSYEFWLDGCGEGHDAPEKNVRIYELASTLVRSPMGGFEPPDITMQQILTFTRIIELLGFELVRAREDAPAQEMGPYYCLIACVAAANEESLTGLSNLGMKLVSPLPVWLQYEHRTWFPNFNSKGRGSCFPPLNWLFKPKTLPREIEKEAVYLWLPQEAARDFIAKMIPIIERRQTIRRPSRGKPGETEEFFVQIDTPTINFLRRTFGSIAAAAEYFDYTILCPTPPRVRVGNAVF